MRKIIIKEILFIIILMVVLIVIGITTLPNEIPEDIKKSNEEIWNSLEVEEKLQVWDFLTDEEKCRVIENYLVE